jgi:hypothetical protein
VIYDDGVYSAVGVGRESKYSVFSRKLMSFEVTLSDICVSDPGLYGSHFKSFREIVSARNSIKGRPTPVVTWVYGHSGVGKTKLCRDLCVGAADVVCVGHSGFVLGYPEQKNLILEDLRFESFKFNVLLNLLSDNSIPIDIKGSHFVCMAENIFITTEKDPKRFVLDNTTSEECWQLIRRLHHIIHCSLEYDEDGNSSYVNEEDPAEMYRD